MKILFAIFAALLVHAPYSSFSEITHPLDALDANEIAQSVALLRASGHADDETPILSLTLHPPPKTKVLAWKDGDAFSREAIATIRRNRITREILIDIDDNRIGSVKEIPGPGQPPLVLPELFAAIDIALANEEMQAGLAKRGVTNLDAVFCGPRTGGNFGEPEQQTRRIVKVDCLDMQNNPTNAFATPIEGLFAIVDLESHEVLRVVDLGAVALPTDTWSLAPDAQASLRQAKPVGISAPKGSNIKIEGWNVSWQNWRFHLSWDARAGLVVSMVRYDDGRSSRSVLYQGNISEIFVPYQDPTEGWYYRNYLDEGDYGLGNMHSPLLAGVDCPSNAIYLSPVMANYAGGVDELDRRVCLFERPGGEATWRHFDMVSEGLDGRANVDLVVRFVATVGNYDYVLDWVFDNKGQISYRAGASGLDGVKGVNSQSLEDESAEDDTAWGPLIAPRRAGINHDHFFSIRLDLDVDGVSNRFVRDRLVAERQGRNSKRKSLWRVEPDVATTDTKAKYRLSYEKPSLWRVESTGSKNYLGYSTSYALKAGGNARPLVDENDPPLTRAQFANYHLWVTPYDPNEMWAAGKFSNQSKPGAGLPAWTMDKRDVEDTDIVLWYTMGFHHVPSAEDWPVYNLGWNSVTLRPYNFFDQNPAMDLPPAE
jgi:primary-amine oxidase